MPRALGPDDGGRVVCTCAVGPLLGLSGIHVVDDISLECDAERLFERQISWVRDGHKTRARFNGRLQRNITMAIPATVLEFAMATTLIVRNIEPTVILALKKAAAAHGRSAEAEHREILRAALCPPARRTFQEVILRMPNVGTDEDFNARSGSM